MIKRILTICLLSLVLVSFTACKGKYADAIEANNEYLSIVEQYSKDLDKASNAEEVVVAIDLFSKNLQKIAPKLKEIQEKYPELQDPNKIPPKLKESLKKTEVVGEEMVKSFTKLMPYLSDPKVAKAQARMGKALEGLANK